MLRGDNNIITKASIAKEETIKGQVKEELQLAIYSIRTNNIDSFDMQLIIENLNKENNLELEQLEGKQVKQKKIPRVYIKDINFI